MDESIKERNVSEKKLSQGVINVSNIVKSILELNDSYPNIYIYKEQDEGFIKTTINGDEIKDYLPIVANLKKVPGVLLYVLTNVRLIKIEIPKNDKISSVSYFLNTMTSIDRKLIENDRISIDIIFQNTSVGLNYPITNIKITEFFQKIEQLKSQKASTNE